MNGENSDGVYGPHSADRNSRAVAGSFRLRLRRVVMFGSACELPRLRKIGRVVCVSPQNDEHPSESIGAQGKDRIARADHRADTERPMTRASVSAAEHRQTRRRFLAGSRLTIG
jgi:hypothetical protein